MFDPRCAMSLALFLCAAPSVVARTPQGVTVVRSTIYERTLWAETDLVDGTPRVFFGVPVPSMLGADTADMFLQDAVLVSGGTVTVNMEQILLNERGAAPASIGGFLYDFMITLDPAVPSLGTMTLSWDGTNGPGPVGSYTRQQTIHFVVTFVPVGAGPPLPPVNASIVVTTPEPIPFTFTPESTIVLKPGLVGDPTANFHTNLQPHQRNIFSPPSLGAGVVMQRPAFVARESARGGGKSMVTQPVQGDECPFDPLKTSPGLTGCGNSDIDANGNGRPDFYDRFLTHRIVLPANASNVEGSSTNRLPWGVTTSVWSGVRVQSFYDSSNLTSQGISGPIVISGIRWRCEGGTAPAGGTHGNATVALAATTTDYTAITTTFEPTTTVYSGPVDVENRPASTPGAWFVEVQFPNSPFTYDPTSGRDLIIDVDNIPGAWVGAGSAWHDVAGVGSMSSRIYSTLSYPAANGTTQDHGVVVELNYHLEGFTYFGIGCPGALGIPDLVASAPPRIGTTFDVSVKNVEIGVAVMITGLDNSTSSIGPLPVDGTPFGAPGCFLRVADTVTELLPSGSPTTVWSLTIPNDPGLIGVKFFNQALVASPSTNLALWVISNGYELTIQP